MPKAKPKTGLSFAMSNPTFKLLVRIVTFTLFASLIGAGVVTFTAHNPATDMEREFSSLCRMGFQMCLGALIGLLGGRAGSADSKPTNP